MGIIEQGFDGWENLFTGVGVKNRDSRYNTSFTSRNFMTEGELNCLYTDDGLSWKIIDKHVEQMMKKPFTVDGDKENAIQSRIDDIGGWVELCRMLKWNRLHGGALLAIGIDDSRPLNEPVDYNNIRSIDFFRTYDRWRVHVERPVDLYSDRSKPNYGEVEVYTVQPSSGLESYKVHESRCVVLTGLDVPDQVKALNNYWGLSFLQHCFEQLRALGEVLANTEVVTKDFVTQTVQMEGLMELLANKKEAVVRRRLDLIDQSRHSLNTVLLDSMEKFEKTASTVSGLSEVIDQFKGMVTAVTGMPRRVLFGEQAGGLNNEGGGETNDWYDNIESEQQLYYKPVLEKIVNLILLSDNGGFNGQPLDSWFIKFPPLKQMTEKEDAEIKKMNSETDANYVNTGVLLSEEVAISRFGGAEYGKEIVLIEQDRSEINPGQENNEKTTGGNDDEVL